MKLYFPYSGTRYISQYYAENANGYYKEKGLSGHGALDIVGQHRENIYASCDGYIYSTLNKDNPDLMKYRAVFQLIEEDGIAYELSYGHLMDIYVEPRTFVKKGTLIGTQGNCFDDLTEILTDSGWKFFKDLNKKESVLTLNSETNEMTWERPYSYTEKEVDYMNYYNSRSLDFAVTDNHSMFSKKYFGKYGFTNFENLNSAMFVKQKGGIWDGEHVEYFNLPEINYVGDRWGSVRTNQAVKINMNYWVELLGWWHTDGYISDGKTKFCGITQSFVNPKKRDRIKFLLDKMPFNYSEEKEDFRIYKKQVFEYLKKYGKKGGKLIPEFIFDLSPAQIRLFLDGFFGGDGWTHKGTKYYMTSQKNIADQLQELLLKCGSFGLIRIVDPTKRKNIPHINGKPVIATKKVYVITEPKSNQAVIRKNKSIRFDYNKKAYCLTVKNHIIYVRRNGMPLWCGNTGNVFTGGKEVTAKMKENNSPAGSHLHFQLRLLKKNDKLDKKTVKLVDENGLLKIDGYYFEIPEYKNGFNGCVDPKPFLVMESAVSTIQEIIEVIQPKLTQTLRYGSRGDQVKILQSKLGIKQDGIFGKMTEAKVKEFQKSKGLVADGICGTLTRKALGDN